MFRDYILGVITRSRWKKWYLEFSACATDLGHGFRYQLVQKVRLFRIYSETRPCRRLKRILNSSSISTLKVNQVFSLKHQIADIYHGVLRGHISLDLGLLHLAAA